MMIRECTHSIDKMDYRWCHHCCCGAEQWTNAQDIDQLRQPTDRRKSNLGSQQCQRTHPSNGIDTIHSVSIYTSILYIDHFRIGRIRILLDVRIVWYHRVLYCTMLIKGAKKKNSIWWHTAFNNVVDVGDKNVLDAYSILVYWYMAISRAVCISAASDKCACARRFVYMFICGSFLYT